MDSFRALVLGVSVPLQPISLLSQHYSSPEPTPWWHDNRIGSSHSGMEEYLTKNIPDPGIMYRLAMIECLRLIGAPPDAIQLPL